MASHNTPFEETITINGHFTPQPITLIIQGWFRLEARQFPPYDMQLKELDVEDVRQPEYLNKGLNSSVQFWSEDADDVNTEIREELEKLFVREYYEY